GIEWHYFELDGQNLRFKDSVTDGSSTLARPYINATSGMEAAEASANSTRSGFLEAHSDFQLTSTGIVYRDLFWASQFARVDYLVGYRHTHLFDRVRVKDSFTVSTGDSDFANGDKVTRFDQFRTVNQFDGADLGLRGWWSNNGKLAITTTSRFGIGAT